MLVHFQVMSTGPVTGAFSLCLPAFCLIALFVESAFLAECVDIFELAISPDDLGYLLT